MALTIHHLRHSQSERVVWLCEELTEVLPGFKYQLELHDRDPVTASAPPAIKNLHPGGTAPIMVDTIVSPPVMLTETQAIVQYIIDIHGQGLLIPKISDPIYPTFLQWYNFANGTLQAMLGRLAMIVLFVKTSQLEVDYENMPFFNVMKSRLSDQLMVIEEHLGGSQYLAGEVLTAADIMTVFSLTTMRGFMPIDLGQHGNILRYLRIASERPAYQRALSKAEGKLQPMIAPQVDKFDYVILR